jgi:hypothetical protein
MSKINSREVEQTFLYCLCKEEKEITEESIITEGIVSKFAFHPERLKEKKKQVKEWFGHFSKFKKGFSFLNFCEENDGTMWTGLHKRMEQLICLGLALDIIKLALPRDFWPVLPGGMPYYYFTKKFQSP